MDVLSFSIFFVLLYCPYVDNLVDSNLGYGRIHAHVQSKNKKNTFFPIAKCGTLFNAIQSISEKVN